MACLLACVLQPCSKSSRLPLLVSHRDKVDNKMLAAAVQWLDVVAWGCRMTVFFADWLSHYFGN
jgi:hypothetical protein